MKGRYYQPPNVLRRHSEPLNDQRRKQVRYVGFEGRDGGRRLMFRVKSAGQDAVDVTFDILESMFIGVPGISIQDAAPMAYEKLNLSNDETLDSPYLYLTAGDMADYRKRHATPQQKSPKAMNGDEKRRNIAA